jgi:pSer/pThr/pTyr-binding forkhead associated (FHA) protein
MYCPECGFHQSQAHNYCERCGALLHVDSAVTGETTGPFAIGDPDADAPGGGGATVEGPALAVRSGGGLSGEIFRLTGERVTVGRDSESDIFLDDVTVSRNHAVLVVTGEAVTLQDLGSLNGTYVNRRRIDAPEALVDGDELQIGKFRLAFIE